MIPPFCIIGAPRSRTTWFAKYLSHGGVHCEHEPSRFFREPADIERFFRPGVGGADTMLALKWRELRAAGVRLTAIVRPANEVSRSLTDLGFPDISDHYAFRRLYSELDNLPDDVPRYEFKDLNPAACADIFERSLGRKPLRAWTGIWTHKIVECDQEELLRDTLSNIDGLKHFYSGII